MREVNPIRWSLYTLPNGKKIYLTQRPDRACGLPEFIKDTKIKVRFSFTDDYAGCVQDYRIPCHWYPWFVGKNIPVASVFSVMCLMSRYVEDYGSIWMHCDSSSMRAPTFFGLFLQAAYPKEIESICNNMTVNPGGDLEYAKHSCAMTYSEISMSRDIGVKELVEAWRSGGEKAAWENYDKDC